MILSKAILSPSTLTKVLPRAITFWPVFLKVQSLLTLDPVITVKFSVKFSLMSCAFKACTIFVFLCWQTGYMFKRRRASSACWRFSSTVGSQTPSSSSCSGTLFYIMSLSFKNAFGIDLSMKSLIWACNSVWNLSESIPVPLQVVQSYFRLFFFVPRHL